MSRTPVREALRKLDKAGLVCIAKNHWTRVAPIEPQDAYDICPIIRTLEPLAIRLGARRTADAQVRCAGGR